MQRSPTLLHPLQPRRQGVFPWLWRRGGKCTVNDLIKARGQGSKRGRLKEKGVYSHYCNKLIKTNMLSAKTSRELKNSGICDPSISTSRPSRDPNRSFKSRHRCQNPRSGLLCCHRQSILTLNLALDKTKYAALLIRQVTE